MPIVKGKNMGKFIAESVESKNALNMATLASSLPVQILIFGEKGTGKRALAKKVSPNALLFDAQKLQNLILKNLINFTDDKNSTFIISDIDNINNIKQFVEKLEANQIKVIATASNEKDSFSEKFAVRIDIEPLLKREADLNALSKFYLNEANNLFDLDVKIEEIKLDISRNSRSLKDSIYKGVIFESLNLEQIQTVLEIFLLKKMNEKSMYKDLLEIFEIPLIKASRKKYKSQLQMAQKLNINRNTLRKKINQYGLGD